MLINPFSGTNISTGFSKVDGTADAAISEKAKKMIDRARVDFSVVPRCLIFPLH